MLALQATNFIRPSGLLTAMSSNIYERKRLPHEDDVAFERVLRNISKQEVMPRPAASGPVEMGRADYTEFFGDTYHWDNFGWGNWIYLGSKFFIGLAGTSTWLTRAVSKSGALRSTISASELHLLVLVPFLM